MYGSGLHKYWWLRLITIVLTIILPLVLLIIFMQNNSNVESYDEYTLVWCCLGWLIYVITLILIMLRIEDYLNKKHKKNIVLNTVTMSEDQKQCFNNIFKNVNMILQDEDYFMTDVNGEMIFCPKCKGQNIAKLATGKLVCVDCKCNFSINN